MMKKLLALMLSLLMLLSMMVVFTACGDDEKKSKSKKSDKSASDEDKDEDEDKDDEDKDDEDKDDEDKDDEDEAKPTKKAVSSGDVTVDETVLVDQNGVKITATGLEESSLYGTVLKVLVENTSGKDLTVRADEVVVNNYAVAGYLYCDVSAGKKVNEEIVMGAATLADLGVETIGLIEASFSAYDDQYNDVLDTDLIALKTSAYDNMDTVPADKMGTELYNKNNVKICAQYYDEGDWDKGVLLLVENKTGKDVDINCESLSINGFEMTALLYHGIPKDKTLIYDLTVYNSDLEDNGIEKVEEVGFKFEISELNSFDPFIETGDLTLKVG